MANQQGYEYEGTVVTNLKDLGELLGEKVSKKDVEEGGKFADQVGIVDMQDDNEDNWDKEVLRNKPAEEKHPMESKNAPEGEIYTSLSDEDMQNLEDLDPKEIQDSLPDFENLEELKSFIKDIDTPTLEYMATGLGLEWNPTNNANIHRMRIAMALQRHVFPELFKPKEAKKKSKYGDFDTKTLETMAKDNNVEVKKSSNEPIYRMNLIMNLKKSGVIVE